MYHVTIDQLIQIIKYIDDLKTLPFESFDELVAETTKIRTIRFNKENWKKSSCNCSWYMKNYLCGHIIALEERKKLHEFDPRADQIPLGQKRKRGRPTKTATALLRQQE